MLNTQNLSQNDYESLRFELLNQLETSNDLEPLLNPILDSLGIPTIGVGLNLRDSNSRSIAFETLGIDPDNAADAPFAERLIEVIERPFEDGQEEELRVALDEVMSERAAALGNERTTFTFSDRDEAISAFNQRVSTVDEPLVDSTVAGIANSLERATLVSLAFNGGAGLIGPNLQAAIEAGDRPEAWYEIRYNSGSSLLSRRFLESEVFGLYDNSNPDSTFRPTQDNALKAFRTFTKHEVDITGDDMDSVAIDIANGNLDAVDERISLSFGDIGVIGQELQPAQTVLIDNFATLPDEIEQQIQRFEPNSFLNTLEEIDSVFVAYEGEQAIGEVAPNTVDRIGQPEQNDLIFGGINNDGTTSESNDLLKGAGGNDLFIAGLGSDSHDGGAGEDTVSYQSSPEGVKIDLQENSAEGGYAAGDDYAEIENIIGSNNNDDLFGNSQPNILVGLDGRDSLNGGRNNDYLLGGNGDDRLVGGSGVDILTGGGGKDEFIVDPAQGINIITDFDFTEDTIRLTNGLDNSQLTITQGMDELSEHTFISLADSDRVITAFVNTDANTLGSLIDTYENNEI